MKKLFDGDKAHYVKQTELDALVQKQVKRIKQKKPVELTGRETAILQLLEEDELVNLGQVTRNQLDAISQQFKEANPEIAVWHVLDRQFDGCHYSSSLRIISTITSRFG